MEHPQVVIGDSRGGNVRLFAFVDFVGIEIGVRISHKRASARTTAYFAQIKTEQWRQAREDHSAQAWPRQ